MKPPSRNPAFKMTKPEDGQLRGFPDDASGNEEASARLTKARDWSWCSVHNCTDSCSAN